MNDDPNYREVEVMGLSELIKLQRRVLRRIKHLKAMEGLPPGRSGKEQRVTAGTLASPGCESAADMRSSV